MPIIDIEIVEDRDESGPGDTRVHTLADALGEVFGSDPGRTWVRVYHLPREHYAENGGEDRLRGEVQAEVVISGLRTSFSASSLSIASDARPAW
jgi:phenylpyruvate tautomerase PptA (4-oxalocrotonate tautomerase family)